MSKTLQNGSFQDAIGTVVNGGTIEFVLSQDAMIIAGGQVAPTLVTATLDSSGDMPAAFTILANDELTPSGTFYLTTVFDSNGARVFGPERWVFSGASPIDLDTLTPTIVDPAFADPILSNPVAAQSINDFNITVPLVNDVRVVDGVKFTTIDAAAADLPGAGGIVIVPSTYAGAEASTAAAVDGIQQSLTTDLVTVIDLRPGATTGYNIQYNSRAQESSNNIETRLSVWQRKSALNVARTCSAILSTNQITGNTPNLTFASMTAEVNTTGAITPGSGVILAVEGYASVRSTGGTLADLRGIHGTALIDRTGASTDITNAISIFASPPTNISSSGATITNAYGLQAGGGSAGTARSYGAYLLGGTAGTNFGNALLGFSSGAFLDSEDSGGVPRRFLFVDSSNNSVLQAINSAGLFLRDSGGATKVSVTSTAVVTATLEGTLTNTPRWIFKQVDHTDMTASATADTFTLWTLPANTMIHDIVGTVVTAWEAVVGLSAAVASVGTQAGAANDLTLDDDFFAAATVYELHDATASGGKGALLFDATDKFAPHMLVAGGVIELQMDLTGDDHADTNAGQARIYALVSQPLGNTTTEAN